MKEIELAGGLLTMVDDEDYETLRVIPWHLLPRHGNLYVAGSKEGKTIYMHREILNSKLGQIVDHIDGNGLNNTRSNLRIVTNSVNCFNRYSFKTNKTGYRGVSFRDGKYRASLTHNKKRYHIGSFKTVEEAGKAWDTLARQLMDKYTPTSKIQQKKIKPKITLSFSELISQPNKKAVRSQSPVVAARVKKKLEERPAKRRIRRRRSETTENRIRNEQLISERRELRNQRRTAKEQKAEVKKSLIQQEQLLLEKIR